MQKSQKNILMMVIGAVLLTGLLFGIYLFKSNADQEQARQEEVAAKMKNQQESIDHFNDVNKRLFGNSATGQ